MIISIFFSFHKEKDALFFVKICVDRANLAEKRFVTKRVCGQKKMRGTGCDALLFEIHDVIIIFIPFFGKKSVYENSFPRIMIPFFLVLESFTLHGRDGHDVNTTRTTGYIL